MGLLLSTRRILIASTAQAWSPALPLPVSGLLPEHWYRSDQGLWQDAGITPAAADGDVVGRWEDLSANADHVNQAVAANKPTLQNGAADLLNGHPVIRVDGINDYLQGAFTTGGAMNQPNTIFAVTMLDAAFVNDGVYHEVYDGNAAAARHSLFQDIAPAPDTWAILGNITILTSATATDADWHIFTALYNGVASSLWLQGVQIAAGAVGIHTLSGLFMFSNYLGTGGFWKGDATELLFYGANLSNADNNTVGNYLATRYALAYTDI